MYLDQVFAWLAQSAAVAFAMGAFAPVPSVLNRPTQQGISVNCKLQFYLFLT